MKEVIAGAFCAILGLLAFLFSIPPMAYLFGLWAGYWQ